MSLQAGKLRHRITLQRRVSTQDDDTGEMIVGWVDVLNPDGSTGQWAHVEDVSVREFIASAAGQSQVTTRCTIRYRDDVDATMRFVFRGKPYNIHGAQADKASGLEYMTLPCSKGVNDGE